MVSRRGLMAMVKRFVALFIGYKGGGGSKSSMICSFLRIGDLILLVKVLMPLPPSSLLSVFTLLPFFLLGWVKKKKGIYLCESVL